MYNRIILNQIKNHFFKGKIIIITGARQTGKTTLALEILQKTGKPDKIKKFNCDNPTDREVLTNKNIEFLEKIIGSAEIVFIDEGQKVLTIGQTLKLMADKFKEDKQIIVTGSSSLNLLDKTEETLTGRKTVFRLFPLSFSEIFSDNLLEAAKELESLLIYGSYPEVATQKSFAEKKEILKELATSNLYKDILEFQEVKNSEVIMNLLKALALQIGSEASYTELSSLLGINKNTVERYIDLLEKCYVIFRLTPYFKNKRREISKMKKIYFYDLGIRNTIINNYNLLNSRSDIGGLWENFLVVERLKLQSYNKIYSNNYFWRTYDGAEIDFVEERDGKLFGYEFKWNSAKKGKSPIKWSKMENSSYEVVNKDNFWDFLKIKK